MAAMGARRPLERLVVGGETLSVVDTGRALVVAGGPSRVDEAEVVAAARARARAVVFFGVPPQGGAEIAIGQEPVWALAAWPAVVAGGRTLRSQIRRAHNKGVVIAPLDPAAPEPGLDALVARWLRTRTLPPLGFVVDVESARPHQRPGPDDLVLVARAEERVVGLLVARAVDAPGEALVEHVLRDVGAPNGTGEALVDHAFRALAERGFTHATLGLAPLRDDPAAPLPRWLATLRDLTGGLFDWRGLDTWKEKLRPTAWRPLVVRAQGVPPLVGLWEVLMAFAHLRPLRFVAATVLRGPPLFYRVVAALLVPWTIGLALIDGRHFPHPAARAAWIVFDLALVAALFWLAFRIKRRVQRVTLHRVLAVAVCLDAAVTVAEALLWNLPRARTTADVAVMVAGCAAPALVGLVLCTSLKHRA